MEASARPFVGVLGQGAKGRCAGKGNRTPETIQGSRLMLVARAAKSVIGALMLGRSGRLG
jgi:hypothetical protein